MRQRFIQPTTLDAVPISEIQIDLRTRHQLEPLLTGLQHIFVTPGLNEKIFKLLEDAIIGDKKNIGRPGMSLWEIFVLGVVRLSLGTDYDALESQANNHMALRGILGVHKLSLFEETKKYSCQTLKDNVPLLTEELLQSINEILVKHGHVLKKKEEEKLGKKATEKARISLNCKTDTYPVQSNIHFPTDINLLWDSFRCTLCTMHKILINLNKKGLSIKGWRKVISNLSKAKNLYKGTANIHQRKGANYQVRLEASCKKYLSLAQKISTQVSEKQAELSLLAIGNIKLMGLLEVLAGYQEMLIKHIDLVDRRILKHEKIPHKEKIFSIFEKHAEWINKGKPNNKIELGHNVLITTDQYNFIIDHQVVIKQHDSALIIPLCDRLSKRFSEQDNYHLHSLSTDKGFGCKLNREYALTVFKLVIMLQKGRKSKARQAEENTEEFIHYRKKHSAIESNINELEHCGVDRVPDKGLPAFKKYVALGVVAYNLKRIGNILIKEQKEKEKKQQKKKAIKPASRKVA